MIKPIIDTLGPKLDQHDYVYPFWGPLLIRTKISKEHLQFLREATGAAKERKRLANDTLAGHLEDEFHIPKDRIEQFNIHFKKYFDFYYSAYAGSWSSTKYEKPLNFKCHDLWVNFQRPGEFNPLHFHESDLSFVIWTEIQQTLKDEFDNFRGSGMGPGAIQFSYGEYMDFSNDGHIFLPQEGEMAIFPSKLKHLVHPFRSDCIRVSVAGNAICNNKKLSGFEALRTAESSCNVP